MTRDPAYDMFRADAERQGFDTLADYFRHYGIVPPAEWQRKMREPVRQPHARTGGAPRLAMSREMPLHDELDRIAAQRTWTEGFAIDKSWGEPGTTIRTPRQAQEEGDA